MLHEKISRYDRARGGTCHEASRKRRSFVQVPATGGSAVFPTAGVVACAATGVERAVRQDAAAALVLGAT